MPSGPVPDFKPRARRTSGLSAYIDLVDKLHLDQHRSVAGVAMKIAEHRVSP